MQSHESGSYLVFFDGPATGCVNPQQIVRCMGIHGLAQREKIKKTIETQVDSSLTPETNDVSGMKRVSAKSSMSAKKPRTSDGETVILLQGNSGEGSGPASGEIQVDAAMYCARFQDGTRG